MIMTGAEYNLIFLCTINFFALLRFSLSIPFTTIIYHIHLMHRGLKKQISRITLVLNSIKNIKNIEKYMIPYAHILSFLVFQQGWCS